ncbi:MAG: hypothetical protein ACOYJS_02615 [Acutalibacteraceae bacterium]|jgi:hypothetical protein
MRYFKTLKDGKITELAKSDGNFTASTEEIERSEYDGLILGIRVFLNGENPQKVKWDINGDGYYDN